MNKNLIIMFVKEPKVGFVKTRLAKTFGEEKTLELYKHFVNDLIDTLKLTNYEFKLCVYPNEKFVKKIFGDYDSFRQEEGDLGIKIQKAFELQFLEGNEKIILIGSDTPHIKKETFEKTFQLLDEKEVVIGPSLDGGYYLIAFHKKSFNASVFENITWSSELVLKQTISKVNKSKLYLLDMLNDIDTQEDLEEFYETYKNSYFDSLNTITFLKDIKNEKI